MEESDPCSIGPFSRRRPRQAETCRCRPGDGGFDIRDSQREMVQAFAPGVEEPAERPLPGERLHQLDFPLSYLDERHGGAFTGHGRAAPLNEPQGAKRDRHLSIEIPNDDGQMRDARGGSHTTAEGR